MTGDPAALVRLRIGIDQPFEEAAYMPLRYVGRITDETPDRPRAERIRRDLIIPIGPGRREEVDVPVGHYLIEAETPAGGVLSRELEVTGDPASLNVDLAERTVEPALAWQSASGSLASPVPEQTQFVSDIFESSEFDIGAIESALREGDRAFSIAPPPSRSLGLLLPALFVLGLGGGGLGSLLGLSETSSESGWLLKSAVGLSSGIIGFIAAMLAAVAVWRLATRRPESHRLGREWVAASAAYGRPRRAASSGRRLRVRAGRLDPGGGDGTALSRVAQALDRPKAWAAMIEPAAADGNPLAPVPTGRSPVSLTGKALGLNPMHQSAFGTTALLADWGDGHAELLVLPLPWRIEQGVPESALNLALPDRPGDRLSATIEDGEFAVILGYLASGQLAAARTLADRAVPHLQAKEVNPYAAAAGAYVLLATDVERADQVWRGWIGNLSAWFPHLADGAVLQGWNLLQTMPDEAAPDRARALFLEATRRGLPVFAEGLRRLRDGLAMFAAEPDPDGELARASAAVEALTLRCNPRQAFTTIRLGR